jgi:hypothetical protein
MSDCLLNKGFYAIFVTINIKGLNMSENLDKQNQNKDYSADNIQVLEGLEAGRKSPARCSGAILSLIRSCRWRRRG